MANEQKGFYQILFSLLGNTIDMSQGVDSIEFEDLTLSQNYQGLSSIVNMQYNANSIVQNITINYIYADMDKELLQRLLASSSYDQLTIDDYGNNNSYYYNNISIITKSYGGLNKDNPNMFKLMLSGNEAVIEA